MKKFIQVFSLLSLLVLFGSASANAQSGYGVEVEIPFAFNVGDHSYEAGNYILKVNKFATGTATLSIRDTNNDEVQTVILNGNGDGASTDIKLVFDMVEGRRVLTRVRTPDHTYAVVGAKNDKDAKRNAEKSQDGSAIGGGANLY